MRHTAPIMNGNAVTAVAVRCVSVCIAVLLLISSARSLAADEPLRPVLAPSSSTRSLEDVEIETRILRALRRDAQLGPLNLGVRISGGTAKLFGPVPTVELKERAVQIVQKIDGVRAVRTSDLYTSRSADGRKRFAVVLQEERPTQTRAASPPTPACVRVTPREPNPPLPGGSALNSAASSIPAGNGQQVTLLAPEIGAPARHTPEAARLTGNPRPPSPNVDLSTAVQSLRQRDVRFQQIRARVEGTTVYIMPGDMPSEDAMMFAQAVRRVPGVRHVIMESGSR